MSKDGETKTVTYDPSSPLRLEGITIHPGEHFPVDINFVQRSGVTVPNDIKDFNVYIRQLVHENNTKHIYGAYVYGINIAATDNALNKRGQTATNPGISTKPAAFYTVYPNPTSSMLNIRYAGTDNALVEVAVTDVSGKTVYRRSNVPMQNGFVYSIKMSSLPSGTYFIRLADNSGHTDTQKFTKQ